MSSRTFLILTLAVSCRAILGQLPKLDNQGWDLASYVSRPEVRSPLLNVTRHDPDAISPGYWFMAPYASLEQSEHVHEFIPYQAGPLIYDNEGELVWSGAYINRNRNTFDFRLSVFNNLPALTFILDAQGGAASFPDGAGMILDTSYQLKASVHIRKPGELLNFHEFNLIDGRTSVSALERPMEIDISSIGIPPKSAYIANYGFREIDIASGKVLFEWYPVPDHMSITESMLMPPANLGLTKAAWDCFHLNSVDKNRDGDYLISMRYTSTIYKISGRDGSILWRLGGKHTNFDQDFNFSSQHDAKFYECNDTVTVISFLDNASDEEHRQPWTSQTSSVKLVALYTDRMEAKLLQSFYRPDGGLTMLRGQAQFLPNNGVFAGWAQQGYISEFAPDGHVVLEAKYVSPRFNSYRAYKFDFVGQPKEPPSLKVHAYGNGDGNGNATRESDVDVGSMASVFHVSWNGATEVKYWQFYGTNNITIHSAGQGANYTLLGNATRAGYETTFMAPAFWAWCYVEAYDRRGRKLGASQVEESALPNLHGANVTVAGLLEAQLRRENATRTVEQVGAQKTVTLRASRGALIGAGVGVILLLLTSVVSVSLLLWKRLPSSPSSRAGVKYAPVRDVDVATEEGEMMDFKIGEGDADDEDEPDGEEYQYKYKDKSSEDDADRVGDLSAPPASPRKYVRGGGHARMGSRDADPNGELPPYKAGHGRTTSVDVDGVQAGGGAEARRVGFSPRVDVDGVQAGGGAEARRAGFSPN